MTWGRRVSIGGIDTTRCPALYARNSGAARRIGLEKRWSIPISGQGEGSCMSVPDSWTPCDGACKALVWVTRIQSGACIPKDQSQSARVPTTLRLASSWCAHLPVCKTCTSTFLVVCPTSGAANRKCVASSLLTVLKGVHPTPSDLLSLNMIELTSNGCHIVQTETHLFIERVYNMCLLNASSQNAMDLSTKIAATI
jgi:hypothetical protein